MIIKNWANCIVLDNRIVIFKYFTKNVVSYIKKVPNLDLPNIPTVFIFLSEKILKLKTKVYFSYVQNTIFLTQCIHFLAQKLKD